MSFTFFTIVIPTVLALLARKNVSYSLLGIFSYDFTSLALGFSVNCLIEPIHDRPRNLLEGFLLGLVSFLIIGIFFILPAGFYEYRWVTGFAGAGFWELGTGDWVILLGRYATMAGYARFVAQRMGGLQRPIRNRVFIRGRRYMRLR